jgi:hypothetical protein
MNLPLKEKKYRHNRAVSAVDAAYWASKAYWSIDEFVLISLGMDPREVKWKGLRSMTQISSTAKQAVEWHDTVTRAALSLDIEAHQGNWVNAKPGAFVEWAKRVDGFLMYKPVLEALKPSGAVKDWQAEHTKVVAERDAERARANAAQTRAAELESQLAAATKPENAGALTKKVESLGKMALAMAISHYQYKPGELKSPATTRIVDAVLNKCGVMIDPGTVLDRLREAYDRLSDYDENGNRIA